MQQIDKGRVGIAVHTSGYLRDIHQVVGLQNDKFGVESSFLVGSGSYQMKLHPRFQQRGEIRPVEWIMLIPF